MKEIEQELSKMTEEAHRLKNLIEMYPDLKKHVGRWGKTVYCSASINGIADNFETRYNCGCCDDSPLELWAYKETKYGNVYTSPTGFSIGERDYEGPELYSDWRNIVKKYGMSDILIQKIEVRFLNSGGVI